ncbi:MAG: hypothetical protein H7315_14095 [Herminiimonas sp.]|nr:hypothetical protein [Herminiimonas sp.]
MAVLSNSLWLFSISLISAVVPMTAVAQTGTLPSPTRTVFKCVVDGKATYSDAPCLGAQRIEITPTRGMNKSTGKELTGADVLRERHSEIMGEAIRPITGLNQKERETQIKRFHLSASAKNECAALDRRILESEAAERTAGAAGQHMIQNSLFQSRARYRATGC